MRALIVLHSYHHRNTEKVARAMAEVLGAEIRSPAELGPAELEAYELVGFGSGIDSDRHYRPLLDYADSLPPAPGRRAFIFSTCGLPAAFATGESFEAQIRKNHAALRAILEARAYAILGDYSCVGFNTNSFLKYFGGLNRGRPDAVDLSRAAAFARELRDRAFGEMPARQTSSAGWGGPVDELRSST